MDYVIWTIPAVFIALTLIVLIREIRSSGTVRRTIPVDIPQKSLDPVQESLDPPRLPATKAPALVPCPKCGEFLNEKNLRRHLDRVHGNFVRCQICNCYIRTDRLARHNRRTHQCNTPERLTPPVVPCPTCWRTVSLPNIIRHLRRVHRSYESQDLGYPHPFENIFMGRDRFVRLPKPVIVDGSNIMALPFSGAER